MKQWLVLAILVTSLAPPPEKPPEGWEEEDVWAGSELYAGPSRRRQQGLGCGGGDATRGAVRFALGDGHCA
jgi:hypothetical protein